MRCEHCSYPIFQYTRCCSYCGEMVENKSNEAKHVHVPQTRIGFFLVQLRRTLIPAWLRTM